MTISGTVEQGPTPRCLFIKHLGYLPYELHGDFDRSVIYPGARVTLIGYVPPFMPGICMRGAPFIVLGVVSAH